MHPLRHFDFSALDRADFGEDAVREEIIAPILRALGYAPSGRLRIVRSQRLAHPFVEIGTTKKRLSLIPDYVLYIGDRPVLVLDAKAPTEHVLAPEHIAQVYSYAINRELRVEWFAVCNGRSLAILHVADPGNVPRYQINLMNLDERWPELVDALAPATLEKPPAPFLKDFGIHLMKLGVTPDVNLAFHRVPILQLAKWDEGAFRFSAQVYSDECDYMSTFQIGATELDALLQDVRDDVSTKIRSAFDSETPNVLVNFDPPLTYVNIFMCTISKEIDENANEHYVTLHVSALSPIDGATSPIERHASATKFGNRS
jgi:hypothetical protein